MKILSYLVGGIIALGWAALAGLLAFHNAWEGVGIGMLLAIPTALMEMVRDREDNRGR